jgi:hypothetical protein
LVIGRPGNPELANRELEAAFVNNEGSLCKIVSPGFVGSVRRLFCVDFKPGLRNLGARSLGYEQHRDYEVKRHGDEGASLNLTYPPVEKGAKQVKHYHPDYTPTIRKKAFWIVEAKSPSKIGYPFDPQYLVQGFQYCIHPEIQAKYLVVTTGLNTAVYDAHGAVFLGQNMYEPIFEIKSAELSRRWEEIYELLSVETLRTRIEADLKTMYDKLCESSLDRNYPRDLIRPIGASELENAKKIEQHVRELSIEKVKSDAELLTAQKANLTAEQACSLMDGPLRWYGTEGVIYAEKSLSDGKSPEEVFDRLR